MPALLKIKWAFLYPLSCRIRFFGGDFSTPVGDNRAVDIEARR